MKYASFATVACIVAPAMLGSALVKADVDMEQGSVPNGIAGPGAGARPTQAAQPVVFARDLGDDIRASVQSSVSQMRQSLSSSLAQQSSSISEKAASITQSYSTVPFTQATNGVCNGSSLNNNCCEGPIVNNKCYPKDASDGGTFVDNAGNGSVVSSDSDSSIDNSSSDNDDDNDNDDSSDNNSNSSEKSNDNDNAGSKVQASLLALAALPAVLIAIL